MAKRGVIFKDDFVSTPGKSWFDMSYDYLFSMNFGELVPSTMMECMAEDIIHAKSDSFTRLAPLVSPTFGKCNLFSYHFYVRNRSIWKQWEEFFADNDQMESWQQANPNWTPPEMPQISPLKVLDALSDRKFERALYSSFDDFLTQSYMIGDATTYLHLIGLTNCQLLAITAANGGKVSIHSGSDDQQGFITTFPFSSTATDTESIFIAFVPNKYDPQLRQDFDSIDAEVAEAKEYNVFSNGSLFDFLGVDLCGHYAEQYATFVRELSTIRTALSDSDYKLGVDAEGNVYCDENYLMNIKKFLSSHKVLCYAYSHNSQLVSVNARSGEYHLHGSQTHADDITALTPVVNYDYSSVISTLPLRAYWQVYIDYFRDQNYISVNKNIDWTRDGEDVDWTQSYDTIFDYFTLQRKSYEHDPYTTALPQAQRGAAVRFLNDANIKGGDLVDVPSGDTAAQNFYVNLSGGYAFTTSTSPTTANTRQQIVVDLSAATIENFRFANALQKLSEKIARSGGRYYEYMRAVYGADIQDAKIDRAIFLGGDKTPIQISEVLQTSASQVTDDQPLGQMAGRGISIGNDDRIEYITPDNGFFVEIVCALPRTNYQQGLAPMFGRLVRLDFAVPDFAQLGEQQVPQKNFGILLKNQKTKSLLVINPVITIISINVTAPAEALKIICLFWTWSRIFDEAPIAGKEFLEVRPDYRQFAVVDKNVEHIYCHMFHDIQVNRALPVFGVPSL